MKKKDYVIGILVLFLIGSWSWFMYVDQLPKSSVDLVEEIFINEGLSGLVAADAALSEEAFPIYQAYFSGEGPSKVSQYTVLEYNDEDHLLMIQTTPGLDNHQIYIRDMGRIDVNAFENILGDL